jgi:hypothetical protein
MAVNTLSEHPTQQAFLKNLACKERSRQHLSGAGESP